MKRQGMLILGLALAVMTSAGAHAQLAPGRLQLSAAPLPADGTYVANDELTFMVDHMGGQARLRFEGSDEVFHLTSEAGPLGGRVLKYDTGTVALQVTGWGGVTLYTEKSQGGLPAEYSDVVRRVDPPPVEAQDVKRLAGRLAQDLSRREDLTIGFAADWEQMTQSDILRALGCDAMRNVAYAVKQLAGAGRRALIADRIHIIRILQGTKPQVTMQKGILAVTISPQGGPSARPSSLAIAKAVQASF